MGRKDLFAAHGGETLLIRYLLYSIPIALFLSGCGSTQENLPYPLTITQEGVGAIHPGDTFDASRIQSALPGFTVETVSQISPQKAPMILIIKRGDNPIVYLLPDADGKNIAQITVLSPLVKDKLNQGVGDNLKPSPSLSCDVDVCRYADFPALGYTIEADRTIREITVQKL